MKIVAYIRSDSPAEIERFEAGVRKRYGEQRFGEEVDFRFYHEGLSGQRWLARALREERGAYLFVVNRLADLGRNMSNLLKTLGRRGHKPVYVMTRGEAYLSKQEEFLIMELLQAEKRFATINRKLGWVTAMATGAQIGRPMRYKLAEAKPVIERFFNRYHRHPSVRELAKELKCSKTVSARLLAEWEKTWIPYGPLT